MCCYCMLLLYTKCCYLSTQLFETGVDEMSWDDLSRGRADWLPVREVHEYRKQAYEVIRDVILQHPALDTTEVGGLMPRHRVQCSHDNVKPKP